MILHTPTIEELEFRRELLADPQTMAYNAKWGGTLDFPPEKWQFWYSRWILNGEGQRFYAYLYSEQEGQFVGEVAYHYDDEIEGCLVNVIVHHRFRGKGYGTQGLGLLCQRCRQDGLTEIYDDIAKDNPSIKLFLQNGFERVRENADGIVVRKKL